MNESALYKYFFGRNCVFTKFGSHRNFVPGLQSLNRNELQICILTIPSSAIII